MILSVITIPARFLDASVEFTKASTGLKIQGQWYYPITRRSKPALESARPLAEVVFYQNRDSSLVDMLLFSDMSGGKFLTVRGYDYTEVQKEGIRIPDRIEIFRTDARGDSQKRLVKIDYHSLKRSK